MSNTKSCEVGYQNLKRSRLSWPRLRVRDKENAISAALKLMNFQYFLPNQHQAKTQNQIGQLER